MKNLLFIILVFLINACSKDDSQPTIQEPAKVTNIYIGGSQKINGKEKATIWKNGVAQLLSTGTSNASRVNAIYVYYDVVYAAGFEVDANVNIATLWINDLKVALSLSSSEAFSIAGYKDLFYIAGKLESKATLWVGNKNSIDTILISTVSNSFAKSIFVANDGNTASGIYLAGRNGSNAWTYQNPQDITTLATNASTAESIFVRGSDIFVAQTNTGLNFLTASLQKNGIAQNTITNNTVMYSVHGDDQNIYAVGAINPNTTNSKATIWENYIPKQLSQLYSQANSVIVSDKNVYVAGYEYDSNTAHYKATLWINGTVQTISTEDCQVKSVFVTVK